MTQTYDDTQDTGPHGRLRDGIDTAKQTANKAVDAASDVAKRATQGIEANPLGLLVGGIAVGAAVGALLPRSEKEKELLAPVGARLGASARAAIAAAKDAGRNELEARGLTKDGAQAQAKELFQGVLKAASSAGSAAKQSATAGSQTE